MNTAKRAHEALTYAYVVVGACCMSCCRQEKCQRYVFMCIAHHRSCCALLEHAKPNLGNQNCQEAVKLDVMFTLQTKRNRSP